MSDISQPSAPPPSAPAPSTPPPAAPTAPAPSAPLPGEVPVNETPVNQPTPLGEQAPPKPPHVARQEALQKAFDRAKQEAAEAAKTQPKRGKPGMGHNQPPEPTEKEAQAKPPEKPQQFRDGGKFARDPAKAQQELPLQPQQPGRQPQPQQIQPLAENAPYRDPPGRFSEHAKTEWHAAPESVRGAVHQMAKEFQGAYERFRGDYEVMEQLRPYHDLATKQGTSLRQAFDSYYGIEQKLRQDIIGGLDIIVQNTARGLGLKNSAGEPVTLQDVAHHIVNMTPEQHQLTAQRNQQSSAEIRIGQLHQTVERQSQVLDQLLYQQRFTGTRSEVDKFAESHPRFDELADLIKSELDLGFPLDVAYQRADRLRPNTAPQTRTQAAQTRKTSISGAPDNSGPTRPSDGRPRRNGEAKHPSREEALARAFRRVGNGI